MNDNDSNLKKGSLLQGGKYVIGNYRTYAIAAIALVTLLVTASFVTPTSDDAPPGSPVFASISGTINGHEHVDLGLSVKWATCNVGASSPTGCGNYYALGETSTKSTYTGENSTTYKKNFGDIKGNSSYDAARANWGGSWRLPTKAECQELIDNCNSEWTTQNGVKGRKFTSKKNGKSIFLPAAGCRGGSSLGYVGGNGGYWSSTPYESNSEEAYYLWLYDSGRDVDWDSRYYGQSVRPVSE